MKVAFLTPEFPHPKLTSSGGIGTSILNLSKGIIDSGNGVVVIVYGQKEDVFFEENGISFYGIKKSGIKGFGRILTQLKIQKLLNKLISEKKIDIVEAPDWNGISSFLKPNCPVVIRLHGSDTYFCHLDNRKVKFKNRFHEKRALQTADGLLSVSQYTADVTNDLFNLNRTFTIIPNGVDLNKFEATHQKQNYKETTILYFGTVIRKKGLLELPLIFNEVFNQRPNTKLMIIGKDARDILSGNNSTWQMTQTLFAAGALQNVNYLGSVPYDEIKKHINSATVCVFPTFAEALPVSWIEAMAMRKAMVASNIGWALELIDSGKNGYLVHPKSHKEFAEKIIELLDNPEIRVKFGSEARKKAEQQFSIQVVAEQSLAFYKRILNKGNEH